MTTSTSTPAFNRAVVEDIAAYSDIVAGFDMDRWSAGEHTGQTSATSPIPHLQHRQPGLRMVARTSIPDDMIAFAQISCAPEGIRWCDFHLEPGWVLA